MLRTAVRRALKSEDGWEQAWTAAVCRKSYVAPALIAMARAGRRIEHVPGHPKTLCASERAGLAVLTARR